MTKRINEEFKGAQRFGMCGRQFYCSVENGFLRERKNKGKEKTGRNKSERKILTGIELWMLGLR